VAACVFFSISFFLFIYQGWPFRLQRYVCQVLSWLCLERHATQTWSHNKDPTTKPLRALTVFACQLHAHWKSARSHMIWSASAPALHARSAPQSNSVPSQVACCSLLHRSNGEVRFCASYVIAAILSAFILSVFTKTLVADVVWVPSRRCCQSAGQAVVAVVLLLLPFWNEGFMLVCFPCTGKFPNQTSSVFPVTYNSGREAILTLFVYSRFPEV